MKILIPLLAGAFLLTACSGGKSFEKIMNGKNLNGWSLYGGGTPGAAWSVDAEGVLTFDPQKPGRGNLVTDQVFKDFHLKLEWKASPGANSGIMFLVQDDKHKYAEPYFTGPEMQIIDNERHPDAKSEKHRAGDLYDLIAANPQNTNPAGTWNAVEIILDNGDLQLIQNGSLVVKTTLWTPEWNQMVAASKFKEWPDFGVFRSGKICLQDHGDLVQFRNISIKQL